MATMLEDWPRRRVAETADWDPATRALEADVFDELRWLEEDASDLEGGGELPGTVSRGELEIGGRPRVTIRWGDWAPAEGYTWYQILQHVSTNLPGTRLNTLKGTRTRIDPLTRLTRADPTGLGRFFDQAPNILYRIFIDDNTKTAYIGETTISVFGRALQHLSTDWEEGGSTKVLKAAQELRQSLGGSKPDTAQRIKFQMKYVTKSDSSLPIGPVRLLLEQYHIIRDRPKFN